MHLTPFIESARKKGTFSKITKIQPSGFAPCLGRCHYWPCAARLSDQGQGEGPELRRNPALPDANRTHSAKTPGVASVSSRNLSQLESIFLAIACSSARFWRAT